MVILPDLPGGEQTWLLALEQLAGAGPAVLLPGSDEACEMLAVHRARIPPALLSFESADGAHQRLMAKDSMFALARKVGVPAPRTRAVATRAQLDAVLAELGLPCILKPTLGHLARARFGLRTTLVQHREELVGLATPLLDAGLKVVLSEWIPGPDTALEGAIVVRTGKGDWPLVYGRRKLRQQPAGTGNASLLAAADVPGTVALAQRLLVAADFIGIAALETKRHADTGEVMLIEVNVRVPQGFGLGDACGADASWRTYATLAGMELPPQPAPRLDRKLLLPTLDARRLRTAFQRREIGLREVVRSYRGVRDVGLLDPRDPGPALMLARGRVRASARRLLRR